MPQTARTLSGCSIAVCQTMGAPQSWPKITAGLPGESASMVSALEGNKMAKAGRAAPALATAAIGSFVAGPIATILLTFVAQPFADIAVHFTPADYVGLMAVAFRNDVQRRDVMHLPRLAGLDHQTGLQSRSLAHECSEK